MKISIPHIHKIEGEAGFWAEVAATGKVKHLKIETLEGLRQIEGILIGRKIKDAPLVISRICGICPIVHILNGCVALEKALNIKVSELTVLMRKLLLAGQIIHSHTLHLFFLSLADFLDIEKDLDLFKKFPKETKAALLIRDFGLKIAKYVGGRAIHPITPQIGGFSKIAGKEKFEEILETAKKAKENSLVLLETLSKINYPEMARKTIFGSLFALTDYSFYQTEIFKIGGKNFSVGDFYSNQIVQDFSKQPPVKRVKFQENSYMLGAIARVYNNSDKLNPSAKEFLDKFSQKRGGREKIFNNVFHNLFFQAVEVIHFIEEVEKIIKEILNHNLSEKNKEIKINKGSGLSAMEAPRGTLFTYFEINNEGRIIDCDIVTPTAQFLNNLEEDLKIYLPNISKLSQKEIHKKIRTLIRVYDPCISCATH